MWKKEWTAEEVFRRYWRGFQRIKALRWAGFAVCACLLAASVFWGRMGQTILLLALYLLYLKGLRSWSALRFSSLNVIMNRDCDPGKFAEVSRLLTERLRRRTTGRAGLNRVHGLWWSGRFEEAVRAVDQVELPSRDREGTLEWRVLRLRCRRFLGDAAGAEAERLAIRQLTEAAKPGSALRQQGERALTVLDAEDALDRRDWDALRSLQARLAATDIVPFQQVVAAWRLAQADLAQGETENALARLRLAADQGGTLYIAQEARRQLAELEA